MIWPLDEEDITLTWAVNADTEYLSYGWKRIADYDGGQVMQISLHQG